MNNVKKQIKDQVNNWIWDQVRYMNHGGPVGDRIYKYVREPVREQVRQQCMEVIRYHLDTSLECVC